nr:PREDICTED: uncharacterized protein LOC108213474 isoform X3 [Daucus carota subsp. sativus]
MALVSAEDDQGVHSSIFHPFFLNIYCMSYLMYKHTAGAVLRESRDTPPAHYVLKLKNFSAFSQNGVDQITSNTFQVGDLHWKIKLFLKGSNGGKDDYVSMYLMLDASKGVKAFFKFFLLDQSRGNYLVVQEFVGEANRFDKFFGVEVFICEGLPLGECYSISKFANISGKYKWVVTQFSGLKEPHDSDEFVIGGYKWKLSLWPEGNKKYKGCSLSIFLVSVDSKSSTTEHEVKAEFELTLNDQLKQKNIKNKATKWFGASTTDWGFPSFIELTDLKDDKKGYLVADECTFEAEVKVLCEGSRKTLKC